MTPGARVAAAIGILDRVGAGEPVERALTNWARASRFAGSGDRAAVRDFVFDVLRRRSSAAALGHGTSGRALALGLLRLEGLEPPEFFTGEGHAPAPLSGSEAEPPPALDAQPDDVRLDLPAWLLPELRRSLGDALEPVAERLRTRAPVGVRVNRLRADHAEAAAALREDGIESAPHPLAATARILTRNARRLRASRAYRDGLIELQDPASQAVVAALLPIEEGAGVLDYCAGGGGKALALAAETRGPIIAHDANPVRMRDIPARAARAGAEIHCRRTDELHACGDYDLVLVDAPCSGSGAWRRQPEAKWTLTPERLSDLLATQARILREAAALVKPGGRLAYATCSLLRCENGDQLDHALSELPGTWTVLSGRVISPLEGGDGFYVFQLKRE